MITWVIGSGGLLGGTVTRMCGHRYEPGAVPWHDTAEAGRVLHQQARGFEKAVGDQPWRVVWAAGAATTSTSRTAAMSEVETLDGLLTGLRSARPAGAGVFFLASSAGGVYAGAAHPPFSTSTPSAPLSPYGELKLAQEELARERLESVIPTVIGRISNLYGPGQNISKLQGLISRLALSSLTQQPANIFVPLSTMRDYLYVDDAARAILALTSPTDVAPGVTTHLLATGRGTTIGQLIRMMKDVTKHRVPVALGAHPSSSAQALDLRLTPSVPLPQVTPLPAGMKVVYQDILERIKESSVAV